ncbi:hypothetical protein SAMN05443252_10165 [Bacillus sp. OV322]|uniref:hypothetical protein n=1 Tax=Bacillus sp. OV322 TaxID=1882764 RepID=UPI0008ECDB0E|nr:hypothetical protein [Bacillus sp. OV322]SFB93445.1 hypothetical protein SAMN05443252_10165 [Bacillus sp. OV322]
MRRYWKTSLIIAASIICIGTFYIQSAQSADKLPQYRINPEEGGADYIKPVVLEGSYLNGSIGEPVEITAKGTVYTGKLPFFKSLENSAAYSKRIKELQSKYHNFMRGKSQETHFYEDSNKLAYVDVTGGYDGDSNNLTFKISQLDKKDKDVTSIKMPVPGRDKYNYIFVSEVQSAGSKIYVVTTNSAQLPDEDHAEEIHVYTFDMHKGKLLDNQTIQRTQGGPKNVHVSFEKALDADEMGPDDYLVFKKVSTEQISNKDGETVDGKTKIDWVVFNLKENIQVKTEIPQEFTSGEENLPVYHHGSVLYFFLEKDHVLHLYKYDAASSIPSKEIAIPLGQKDLRVNSLLINKEKVFVMAVSGEEDFGGKDKILIAADLNSGKQVFKGNILEGKGNKKAGKDLQIDGISIN